MINRSRRLDARIAAIVAIFLSLVAITLTVVYALADFVVTTFHKIG